MTQTQKTFGANYRYIIIIPTMNSIINLFAYLLFCLHWYFPSSAGSAFVVHKLSKSCKNSQLNASWERYNGCDICLPDDPDNVCIFWIIWLLFHCFWIIMNFIKLNWNLIFVFLEDSKGNCPFYRRDWIGCFSSTEL